MIQRCTSSIFATFFNWGNFVIERTSTVILNLKCSPTVRFKQRLLWTLRSILHCRYWYPPRGFIFNLSLRKQREFDRRYSNFTHHVSSFRHLFQLHGFLYKSRKSSYIFRTHRRVIKCKDVSFLSQNMYSITMAY